MAFGLVAALSHHTCRFTAADRRGNDGWLLPAYLQGMQGEMYGGLCPFLGRRLRASFPLLPISTWLVITEIT